MSQDFEAAVGLVLSFEGGYSNHTKDPGGATNYGISLRFLRGIEPDATEDDIRKMTLVRAKALYREHFWDSIRGDDLPYSIALGVFDSAVNQGVGYASRTLQNVVAAKEDGRIGPQTVAAVLARTGGTWERHDLLVNFFAKRAMGYALNKNIRTFGLGWFRRLLRVFLYCVLA